MEERKDKLAVSTRLLLMLLLIINEFGAIYYIVRNAGLLYEIGTLPGQLSMVYSVLAVLNIILIVAIFNGRKWGAYGLLATTVLDLVLGFVTNPYGFGPIMANIAGVIIMFFALVPIIRKDS